MKARRVISGAFVGAALVVTTACSGSVSVGKSVDEEHLERQLSQMIEDKVGAKPDKVDCPGDLKGKAGATLECTLTDDNIEYAVVLTVTDVDGSDIGFKWEVVDGPENEGAPGATVAETDVEQQVSSLLEKQVGQRPDAVECPGDLDRKVGVTMRCTLTAGNDELGLTVTVTEVDGSTVNFDVEVDES